MSTPGIRPYVWMLCGCFWFSLMAFLANAAGHEGVDWRAVAFARSALATVFALTIALGTGAKLVFVRPGMLWVRSISGSCSMVCTFYALTTPTFPVSNTLTLTNTFPIWVAVLSWPLSGERPTLGVWGAAGCAVLGVALTQQSATVLTLLGFRDGPVGWTEFPPAAWAALGASVFTAGAMMGLNRLKGVSSMGVVVHFSAVSTLFALGSFVVLHPPTGTHRLTDPAVLGLLLGVGAAATVGQVFLTLAFRSGTATKVSVVGLSQVVMVMLAEAAVGRRFDAVQVIGTALVLGPTAWLMARERKRAVKV